MMLWLTSLAYSFRKDSSFFSQREQLCEKSEQPQWAGGTWLQLLQLSRSSDSDASSLRCRERLNLRSSVLRRLYQRLFLLSSTRLLLRRKLDRLRGLLSTQILGSLKRCDSMGELACVVRVFSFLRGRKARRGRSSSAGCSLAWICGSACLGRGDISAHVILLSTMRGESQSSLLMALSLRLSAALELVRLWRRESFLDLVRERPLGEGWLGRAWLMEREMPVRLGAVERLSAVLRRGSSRWEGEEGERLSSYLSSCESTKWPGAGSPRWQWLMVWQIFTVLQRLNIPPVSGILDLLIIMTHFIHSNKYIQRDFPPNNFNFISYPPSQLQTSTKIILAREKVVQRGKLWVWEGGDNQLVEISINNKFMERHYCIGDGQAESCCVFVGDGLFVVGV